VTFLRKDELGNNAVVKLPAGSGPTGLARMSDGTVLVCCYDVHRLLFLHGTCDPVCSIPFPNDLVADDRGGAFVTSSSTSTTHRDAFDPSLPASGSVYYYSHREGTCTRLEAPRPLHYANGVAIAFGGSVLLVAEHFRNRVIAYDVAYDADGSPALSGERVFLDLPEDAGGGPLMGPDGLCCVGRRLFVAHFGCGRVVEADAVTGAQLHRGLPPAMRFATNVALAEDGATLVVTGFPDGSTMGSVLALAL
jgi:sugar lactone lactonase YvrE